MRADVWRQGGGIPKVFPEHAFIFVPFFCTSIFELMGGKYLLNSCFRCCLISNFLGVSLRRIICYLCCFLTEAAAQRTIELISYPSAKSSFRGSCTYLFRILSNNIIMVFREAVKNYSADFFSLRGGGTPHSAKLFCAQWLSVKGGEYPPIPLRKISAKKTAIFGQRTPILALFDPFF